LATVAPASANALRGDFIVNYIIYMNPGGSVNDYYVQYSLVLHGNSVGHSVNITMELPENSRLIDYSGSPIINGNSLTWITYIPPYGQSQVRVDFRPFFTTLPIADVRFTELLNGSRVVGDEVNGSVGSMVTLRLSLSNRIPYPAVATVSLVRTSGVDYGYSESPTLSQNLAGYTVDYWLMQVGNESTLVFNMTMVDMGPWHAVRLSPVNVEIGVNVNSSIALLRNEISG
jgi:hypothetical protein